MTRGVSTRKTSLGFDVFHLHYTADADKSPETEAGRALVSELTGLSRKQGMKTAGIGNQNRYATERSEPSLWNGSREHLLLNYTGWKTTKTPVAGEVFFLTFPFIELPRGSRLAVVIYAEN